MSFIAPPAGRVSLANHIAGPFWHSWVEIRTPSLVSEQFTIVFGVDPVERHGEELLELSQQQGFRLFTAFALCLVGYGRFLGGDHDGAASLLRDGIDRYHAAKQRVGLRFRSMFAELLIEADKIHEALATLEVMLSTVMQTGQHGSLPEGLRMKAHALARRSPDDPDIEVLLTRAVDVALACGADLLALRAATSLVTLCRQRPVFPVAVARLREIYARFDEGLELHDLTTARAVLATAAT